MALSTGIKVPSSMCGNTQTMRSFDSEKAIVHFPNHLGARDSETKKGDWAIYDQQNLGG